MNGSVGILLGSTETVIGGIPGMVIGVLVNEYPPLAPPPAAAVLETGAACPDATDDGSDCLGAL